MDEKWLQATLDAADKEISKRLKLSGENRMKYKLLSAAFVDENGLYLLVTPTARRWVQRVVLRGRRRELNLGDFPRVTLAEAREIALAICKVASSEKRRGWMWHWLNRGAPPVDILIRAWLDGEGSDEGLSKWIAASKTHWHAWEGLQCLLKVLRKKNQPVPEALREWGDDVATGKCQPQKRKRGRDGFQNVFRDFFIVVDVKELELYRVPVTSIRHRSSACHIVASCGDTSYDAVRNIWKSSKGRKLREALGLYSGDPRGFWDWVGEQVRDKGLLSDHVNLSDMDPDWR